MKPDYSALYCPRCGRLASLLLNGTVYYSAPLQYEADCSACGESVLIQERGLNDHTLVVRPNPFTPRRVE